MHGAWVEVDARRAASVPDGATVAEDISIRATTPAKDDIIKTTQKK